MSRIADLYRRYMPIKLRYKLGKTRMKRAENRLYERICSGEWDECYKKECDYMRNKGKIETFPYEWIEEYRPDYIRVYMDSEKRMPYIKVDGKNLYFPKRYPVEYIRTYFNTLRIEQDPRSTHFYFDPLDDRLKNATFVDVGGAEGFISLEVVDYAKEVIIFECDQDWINALQTSFAPWKEKVTIINRFASDKSDGNNVRIDDVVAGKDNVVLKMDVEGMEALVLAGAEETLKKNDTKAFVCTYHRANDGVDLVNLLKKYGYEIEIPESFMFYGFVDAGFRKGMARAWRKIKLDVSER